MRLSPPATRLSHKYACSLCSRRKVKCDKSDPCSNCLKAHARCSYEAPAAHRPRKRAADVELLARLTRYEELMRKHNVDFTNHANVWMPSELEGKLQEGSSKCPTPKTHTRPNPSSSKSYPLEIVVANGERCLWSNLRMELKYPPFQTLRRRDDPYWYPTTPLHLMVSGEQPELYQLQPEPRHMLKLWQIFVETVNPLTKVVHVPTLQRRIIDASWDPTSVPTPLRATLFAVCTLAVTSIPSHECLTTFGETRTTLMMRYRTASLRALFAAEFLTTRDFETLQALVLFLLADPESDLTSSLAGSAIKLGQKMGLNQENNDPKVSFFEKEMRVRLWWRLISLDAQSRSISSPGMKPPPSELGEVRLPLNVNDADLHPHMTEPPMEHHGPTEMLCVLIKFEISNWFRTSPMAARILQNLKRVPGTARPVMPLEEDAIKDIESVYEEKYFCYLDERIPLHRLTRAMAKLALCRMRLMVHHPQVRGVDGNGEVHMTREESDSLFEWALTALEMVDVGARSRFSPYIFPHMTSKFQVDAYIYVISDLRWRCSGERVALAWRLVEDLYSEHPGLIDEAENTFYVALGDLTLDAWEARMKELLRGQCVQESDITPHFVKMLGDKRRKTTEESVQGAMVPQPNPQEGIMFTDDADLEWEYWDDFFRL